MWQRQITRIHFSGPGWHNKLLITHFTQAASPLAPRFSLVICTEDMADFPWAVADHLFDPLHLIAAGERLVRQRWAAGFVTLSVNLCDPRVTWQATVAPKGLRSTPWGDQGGKWAGEDDDYDCWASRKGRASVHLSESWYTASSSRCWTQIWRLVHTGEAI